MLSNLSKLGNQVEEETTGEEKEEEATRQKPRNSEEFSPSPSTELLKFFFLRMR